MPILRVFLPCTVPSFRKPSSYRIVEHLFYLLVLILYFESKNSWNSGLGICHKCSIHEIDLVRMVRFDFLVVSVILLDFVHVQRHVTLVCESVSGSDRVTYCRFVVVSACVI
jgi:hypothetical protein